MPKPGLHLVLKKMSKDDEISVKLLKSHPCRVTAVLASREGLTEY